MPHDSKPSLHLIREDGGMKVFGASLLSSAGEIQHVMSERTPILPFTVDRVIGHDKAIYAYNEVLCVFESLPALKAELQAYFDGVPTVQPLEEVGQAQVDESVVEDWELADLSGSG